MRSAEPSSGVASAWRAVYTAMIGSTPVARESRPLTSMGAFRGVAQRSCGFGGNSPVIFGGGAWRPGPGGKFARCLAVLSVQPQLVSTLRSEGRGGSALGDDLPPFGQGGRAPFSVEVAADEVTLLIEVVVEGGMG